MNTTRVLFFSMGLILGPTLGSASTLESLTDLPVAIQQCLTTAECNVSSESDFDHNGIAAFRYQANTVSGYLFRYPVLPPSTAIPPAGNLWLNVLDTYSRSADSRPMLLYLDQSSFNTLPRYGQTDEFPTVLHFELSADSLLDSRAFRNLGLSEEGVVESGDLTALEPLLPCLADGCSLSQELNLIGMSFVENNNELKLQFAPEDFRRMLYAESLSYNQFEPFFYQRELYVQPVPLPAAWLVWLTGFGLFACLKRPQSMIS